MRGGIYVNPPTFGSTGRQTDGALVLGHEMMEMLARERTWQASGREAPGPSPAMVYHNTAIQYEGVIKALRAIRGIH